MAAIVPPGAQPISFHGIPAIALSGPQGASAIISLQGAQLLSWIPASGREWLYLSGQADYSGATAIRGGVPVCFPQFSGQGDLPKHGLVRCLPWNLVDQHADDESVSVTLGLSDSAQTRQLWPHAFLIKLEISLSALSVEIAFAIENTGAQTFSFTAALHTYLRVDEISWVQIGGLNGVDYRDAVNGNREEIERHPWIVIDGEVDRVYHAALGLELRDGAGTLAIDSAGFAETVVWNPGAEKCAALVDMPPADFRRMLCIEAACADVGIELTPARRWQGSQTMRADGA